MTNNGYHIVPMAEKCALHCCMMTGNMTYMTYMTSQAQDNEFVMIRA